MMLLKYWMLVPALLIGAGAGACINEYRTLLDGKTVMREAGAYGVPNGYPFRSSAFCREYLHRADSIYRATGSPEDYSDYGAALLYAHQFEAGLDVFLAIEAASPGKYTTAANLGTAYELLGEDDSAYVWISRAVRINPQEHHGSEWIHQKILEAKISARGDTAWFRHHRVLGLDFGTDDIPANRTGKDASMLFEQLAYQLSERMAFIYPEDAVAGQLLFDLGNAGAVSRDVQTALAAYSAAYEYGLRSDLLIRRQTALRQMQWPEQLRNIAYRWEHDHQTLAVMLFAGCPVLFAGGLVWWVRRVRRRRKARRF